MHELVMQDPLPIHTQLHWEFQKLWLIRFCLENFIVFAMQYIGLFVSNLSPYPNFLWLATGTSIAAVMLRGYRVLPGIFLGTLSAYWLVKNNFMLSCWAALLYSLQANLILWCMHQYIAPTLIFYRLSQFIKFLLLIVFITASVSYLFVISTPKSDEMSFLLLWCMGWLADLNGILIFAIALVTFESFYMQIEDFKNSLSLMLAYGLLFIVMGLILTSKSSVELILFSLGSLPIVMFISRRFGWPGIVSAMFLLTFTVNLAAYLNIESFKKYLTQDIFLGMSFLFFAETCVGMVLTFKKTTLDATQTFFSSISS